MKDFFSARGTFLGLSVGCLIGWVENFEILQTLKIGCVNVDMPRSQLRPAKPF